MLSYKIWHDCLSPEAHTLEILIHTQEPKHEAWDENCAKKERPRVCKRASTRVASYLTRSPGTQCPCRSSNLSVTPPAPRRGQAPYSAPLTHYLSGPSYAVVGRERAEFFPASRWKFKENNVRPSQIAAHSPPQMAASQRQIYNISELGSDPCSEREQFGRYMAILWYSRGKKKQSF